MDAYHDISPRVGLAYDLFGNGKTSFKANVGTLPASRVQRRALRCGQPGGARGDAGQPALDRRQRQLRRRLRRAQRDHSGQSRGRWRPVRPGRPELRPEPGDHHARPVGPQGWKARPYDWQFGLSVQQELMPRVSAEVGYYRRWWPIYDGADVTDNIAVAPSEFGQFSVVAPSDPRLPNGGGYTVRRALQHHACRRGARLGERAQGRRTRTATMTATGTAST